MGENAREILRRVLGLGGRLDDDAELALAGEDRRRLDAVAAVDEDIGRHLVEVRGIDVEQRDLARTEAASALEFDAPGPGLAGPDEAAALDAGGAVVVGEELGVLHREDALGVKLELGVALLVERVRGDRIGGAAPVRVGRNEGGGAVVVDFGHEAVRGRAGIAGERSALEHVADMVGKAGVDAAAYHVRREQRDVAGASGEDILGAALERGHEGMDTHLADDRAFAQRGLVELGAEPGRTQRARLQLLDDGLRVDLGADHGDLGVLDAQLGEDFLGDVEHEVEVAVAAGHLPRMTGTPSLLPASTMWR